MEYNEEEVTEDEVGLGVEEDAAEVEEEGAERWRLFGYQDVEKSP